MRTLMGILFALFVSTAQAQEIQVGQGLVCDTSAQVGSFLTKDQADPRAALQAVNEEANDPTACVLSRFAFVKGQPGDTVRNEKGSWIVTEILVIAVLTPHGWQRIAPHAYWSAFRIDEQGA